MRSETGTLVTFGLKLEFSKCTTSAMIHDPTVRISVSEPRCHATWPAAQVVCADLLSLVFASQPATEGNLAIGSALLHLVWLGVASRLEEGQLVTSQVSLRA